MTVYTREELEIILSSLEEGMPLEELAEDLGRKPYAIASKIAELSGKDRRFKRVLKTIPTPNRIYYYEHQEICTQHHREDYKKHKKARRKWQLDYDNAHRKENLRKWFEYYDRKHKGAKTRREFKKSIDWGKFRKYLSSCLLEYWGKNGEVAVQLGIPQTTLSGYLHGRNFPSADFFRKLADYSGIDYEEFADSFRRR